MIAIEQATDKHSPLIQSIGKQSFIEAHGNSAPKEILNQYINQKFNLQEIKNELDDIENIFHIIYYNGKAIGYSKIILDAHHPNVKIENVTKLERIYILQEFHSLKLGYELFKFNLNFSKRNNEKGMWLFVWDKNDKAIQFYTKIGFEIIGSHNFYLSKTHYNPNHHMFLKY